MEHWWELDTPQIEKGSCVKVSPDSEIARNLIQKQLMVSTWTRRSGLLRELLPDSLSASGRSQDQRRKNQVLRASLGKV